MALKNIKRPNVSEMVFEQLKEAISSGEWATGTQIPSENELTQLLGVSRITIRSALQKLSSLGVIESRQGEGTFVCEYSSASYMNAMIPMILLSKPDRDSIFEFRRILEVESAALAAIRADKKIIEDLRANFELMKSNKNDVAEAAECDAQFHLIIAQATKNPVIIQTYTILKDAIKSSLSENIALVGLKNGISNHPKIIDAIEAHNPDQAKLMMKEHLNKAWETMQTVLEKNESLQKP
jgi:GntR family transcriptional repressor for pyruvate dehydrogenase complex